MGKIIHLQGRALPELINPSDNSVVYSSILLFNGFGYDSNAKIEELADKSGLLRLGSLVLGMYSFALWVYLSSIYSKFRAIYNVEKDPSLRAEMKLRYLL